MTINQWRQFGEIYIWKYKNCSRHYAGWHLNADCDGCRCLIEFLQLLDSEDAQAKRTINLAKPSKNQYNVPTRGYKIKAETKIVITKSSTDTDFEIREDEKKLHLLIGSSQIPTLILGVTDVLNGKGDYCIGSGANKLWFWWSV